MKMATKKKNKIVEGKQSVQSADPYAHWPEKSNERARGSCLLLKTFDFLMILQGSNWVTELGLV